MSQVDKILIEKRWQLTTGEKGVYWALAKCKKGYSTINEELWSLCVAAFNDHPHVIVSRTQRTCCNSRTTTARRCQFARC